MKYILLSYFLISFLVKANDFNIATIHSLEGPEISFVSLLGVDPVSYDEIYDNHQIAEESSVQERDGSIFLATNSQNQKVVIKICKAEIVFKVLTLLKEHIYDPAIRRNDSVREAFLNRGFAPLLNYGVNDQTGDYIAVWEKGECDLEAKIKNIKSYGQCFSDHTIKNITMNITNALSFLHQHGIYHRDIKPNNIVLFGNRYCLIDFDLAGDRYEEKKHYGSLLYFPADRVLCLDETIEENFEKFEVFQLGFVLLTLVTKENFYENIIKSNYTGYLATYREALKQLKLILSDKNTYSSLLKNFCKIKNFPSNHTYYNLIMAMTCISAAARPTIEEIQNCL